MQAGVQVSRLEDKDIIFSIGSALEDFILWPKIHDAMALCRTYGNPDLFITFTSNPKWPEIGEMLAYVPGQKPHDRPEVGTRVYKLKLTELLDDLQKTKSLARAVQLCMSSNSKSEACPMLTFCCDWNRTVNARHQDDIILAELPSPTDDPNGFKVVTEYMLHGPCRKDGRYAPCTTEGKCTKRYPKAFYAETVLDDDGRDEVKFPLAKLKPNNIARFRKLASFAREGRQNVEARQTKKCIGRIIYSTPASGERYYLRMLLNVVRGTQKFEELLTVNNRLCVTFKAACFAYGLLDDDREWTRAISKANGEDEPTWIEIPEEFLIKSSDSPIEQIVVETYPNCIERQHDDDYLKERAILTPKRLRKKLQTKGVQNEGRQTHHGKGSSSLLTKAVKATNRQALRTHLQPNSNTHNVTYQSSVEQK
ncbi:ATP-dependent DNA helicase PIF1-like protein [Tanacetum coccineum]|uniref:ATP-dependent DNA helicase PIF1-like protein n=1 Tax=Tanacetum coccineum TaxID=301880 RepID=A0ABQ4XH43_9ASTR